MSLNDLGPRVDNSEPMERERWADRARRGRKASILVRCWRNAYDDGGADATSV